MTRLDQNLEKLRNADFALWTTLVLQGDLPAWQPYRVTYSCTSHTGSDLPTCQPYREWLTYVPAIQGVTYLLYVPAMQGVTYLRASHTGSDLPTCQPCQTARKTRVVNWLIIRLFRNLSRCKERENSLYKYSFSLGMHRIIRSFSYSYPAEYRTLKVM